jgi:hypothetical protein
MKIPKFAQPLTFISLYFFGSQAINACETFDFSGVPLIPALIGGVLIGILAFELETIIWQRKGLWPGRPSLFMIRMICWSIFWLAFGHAVIVTALAVFSCTFFHSHIACGGPPFIFKAFVYFIFSLIPAFPVGLIVGLCSGSLWLSWMKPVAVD